MRNINKLEVISGRYEQEYREPKSGPLRCATKEEKAIFKSLLAVDNVYSSGFEETESYIEFFETFSVFRDLLPKEVREDVFYSVKLGYSFTDIPARLVYIIKKAISEYDSPNLALINVNINTWGRFLKKGTLPEGVTIKTVVENVLGHEYTAISSFNRKAKYRDWYEIYVENIDTVILVPEPIANLIDSLDDLKHLEYIQDKGICLYEKPIRVLSNYIGLTKSDLDLRKVI